MAKGSLGHFKNGQIKNVRSCYVKRRRRKTSKARPSSSSTEKVSDNEDEDNEIELIGELTLEQRLTANLQAARARGEVIVIEDEDVVYIGRGSVKQQLRH